MEDSFDTLSEIFKKPDSVCLVQNQSHSSESSQSRSSKNNSASCNINDSVSTLSSIFQKPKNCLASSTDSSRPIETSKLLSSSFQDVIADDTVICKRKKFKVNLPANANSSNLFSNTPTLLSESVVREPKRRKCFKSGSQKDVSLAAQFSMCDSTDSSIVLPKKQLVRLSTVARKSNSKPLSLFDKTKSAAVSGRFQSLHLFDSEPDSTCESITSKNKTKSKRVRDNSTHQQSLLDKLSEFSNISDEDEERLARKRLVLSGDKENVDINFDGTFSSVGDSVTEKERGGFINIFRKAKNSTATGSVNIFNHPEGLSDESESTVVSQEDEDQFLSNATNEDESSSSCREPESTVRSSSLSAQESSFSEKSTIKSSEENLSATVNSEQPSEPSQDRSLRKSTSFRGDSNILADLSTIEHSKLAIQPTLLELDENQDLQISVEKVAPKFVGEINESSVDKFVLTLELSEQQNSIQSFLREKDEGAQNVSGNAEKSIQFEAVGDRAENIENISLSSVNAVSRTAESIQFPMEERYISNIDDVQKSVQETSVRSNRNIQENSVRSIENIHIAMVTETSKTAENIQSSLSNQQLDNSEVKSVFVDGEAAKIIENVQMSIVESASEISENLRRSFEKQPDDYIQDIQLSVAEDSLKNEDNTQMSIAESTLRNVKDMQITLENQVERNVENNESTPRSSENVSIRKSTEIEPDRLCFVETRKKRRMSPRSPISFTKVDDINTEFCSGLRVEALCESITVTQNESEAAFCVQKSVVDESKNVPGNSSPKNLFAEKIPSNDFTSTKSTLSNSVVDEVQHMSENITADDNNFTLAMELDSDETLSNANMSLASIRMGLPSRDSGTKSRINDETRVLHSATYVASVSNCCIQENQNNTYVVQDPVIFRDGTRTSQTLSSLFHRPGALCLSQNDSDSVLVSQESSDIDGLKNRTYTVQKTLADESSLMLLKKKAGFHQSNAADDLSMFSINSNLLSETVTIERRVTRASARLSTLSAQLNVSVPSQPRNSRRSSLRNKSDASSSSNASNKSNTSNRSKVFNKSLCTSVVKENDKSVTAKGNLQQIDKPGLKENKVETAVELQSADVLKIAVSESHCSEEFRAEEKFQHLDKSELVSQRTEESRPAKLSEPEKSLLLEDMEPEESRPVEVLELEKSQIVAESEPEDESQSMEESEPEESHAAEESASEESQPEMESEPEESEPMVESEHEESQPEVESEPEESEPMVESEPEESQPEVESEPEKSEPMVESEPEESQSKVESECEESEPIVESESEESQPEVESEPEKFQLRKESEPGEVSQPMEASVLELENSHSAEGSLAGKCGSRQSEETKSEINKSVSTIQSQFDNRLEKSRVKKSDSQQIKDSFIREKESMAADKSQPVRGLQMEKGELWPINSVQSNNKPAETQAEENSSLDLSAGLREECSKLQPSTVDINPETLATEDDENVGSHSSDDETDEKGKSEDDENYVSSASDKEQDGVDNVESTNLQAEEVSSNVSSIFKKPDSIYATRSRSKIASMSLSSTRRRSVSFAQGADCTQFTSQSSRSKTHSTDASMSLVRKMCEEKSSILTSGKKPPPKKKKQKPLRLELDSDDDDFDDSINALPKKPKFPKFHSFCGQQFYNRIIEKMTAKYGLKTNLEAVRLAEYAWKSVKFVIKCRDVDVINEKVDEMKRTFFRKRIVVTHADFYWFCLNNFPLRYNQQAVPMAMLNSPVKFDITKAYDPIMEES